MNAFALCAMLSVVGAGNEGASYEQAYKAAEGNNRPIMVLVGADWCPGCRTMKGGVLSRMFRAGRLSRVNYAVVNTDQERELASRLMRGGSIPQLIVYAPTGKDKDGNMTWAREQITGATSEEGVAAMIERASAKSAASQQKSDEAKSAQASEKAESASS